MDDEAAKDYKEESIVPDPTWAERLVTWFKLMNGLRKTILALMAIGVIGVGGNIAEINPWKEAAIEVGLVEPELSTEPVGNVDNPQFALPDQFALAGHTHVETSYDHAGEAHPYAALVHSHPAPPVVAVTPEATTAAIRAEIEKLLPPNHRSLH